MCEISKGEQLNRATLAEKGRIPVYNGGSSPSGYAEESNTAAESVIISEGGNSCGYVNFIHVPFWRGGHCYLVETDLDKSLLYYVLKANEPQIMSLRVGTGLPNIQRERLEAFEFDLPTDSTEQRQIVTTCISIDTHITALQALIAKYEAIKKATVNLLLKPKEGWRCVKLGDMCNRFSYGIGAPAIPYDGINKYIRITDIDDLSRAFAPSPLSSPSHFTTDHIVNEGDILLARTGASVGKSYLYNPGDGKLIFAGFLIRASVNSDVVDSHFLFLQTLTDRYWQWVAEESMRSGQPGLNINQYKELDICIPSLSEQRKIAEQITAIDNVLADYNAQLEKARQLKAGMMSYFFG